MDILVGLVESEFGVGAVEKGVALRDSVGRLSFVAASMAPPDDERNRITDTFIASLDGYARGGDTLIFADDPGASLLLEDRSRLPFSFNDRTCWVIDRRIVGSGWMAAPQSIIASPPRVVFASLKGGVGRSTALSVSAMDMAERGNNVLVIDLDLEAPGLADIILGAERAPRFGVLDYLVEDGIRLIQDEELTDYVGLSPMTRGGTGRVDVIPAFGRSSTEHPENVLPKLSRAMIEDVTSTGESVTVGQQIAAMIDRFASRESYDVVLIDSRAGLAELTAPAVLNLGALVLLFGTAQHQTISGYRSLFAALRLLAVSELATGTSAEWRLLLKPVYSKADLSDPAADVHIANLYELFADNLYDAVDDTDGGAGEGQNNAINFAADDPDAPHTPLVIPFDTRFVGFDPVRESSHLARPFYEQTFRPFLDQLERSIANLRHATAHDRQ